MVEIGPNLTSVITGVVTVTFTIVMAWIIVKN